MYKQYLVGGVNPFQKYDCQNGNLPQIGMNINYFTSSDPHHDMLGGGCQVRVIIENMMGRIDIDFRFPWLSDTSEMGFGHDVPFLKYSDRLPHPSDLCQPDRVR